MARLEHISSWRRGATWLNGSIWALSLVTFAYTLVLQEYKLFLPFLHAFVIVGVGILANLFLCLGLLATGRGQHLKPYLLGFIALGVVAAGGGSWLFFFDTEAGC